MANKELDIELLFDKLSFLDAEPDASAWFDIKDRLNLIDLTIADKLDQLDLEPNKFFFENVILDLQEENSVDRLLTEHLAAIEIDPKKTFEEIIPRERKRRIGFFLLIQTLTLFIFYFFYQNQIFIDTREKFQILSKDLIQDSISKFNKKSNVKSETIVYKPHITGQINIINKHSNFQKIKELVNKINTTTIEIESEIEPFSKLTLYKNKLNYSIDESNFVEFQKRGLHKKPLILNKLNWFLGFGQQNQTLLSVQIDQAEYQHKDALINSKESLGKNLIGIQITTGIDLNIQKRIFTRIGFQFNYTSRSTNFEYIYTDIPVYGIDGKIIGYFKRPISASPHINQKIKTTSQSLTMPVEVSYQILQMKKRKLYLGMGLNVELMNQIKSSNFNFSDEKINESKFSTSHLLSPTLSLQYIYTLTPGVNFHFQYQGKQTNSLANFDDSKIYSKYLISTVSIGFSFAPKFK